MTDRPASVDPAVAALLREGKKRERTRRMTPAERKKAKKDAARSKATYDLPPEIIKTINAVAEREKCSASSVAAFLLTYGIQLLARGSINPASHKRDARRSIRFEYTLEIDEDLLEIVRNYLSTLASTPA